MSGQAPSQGLSNTAPEEISPGRRLSANYAIFAAPCLCFPCNALAYSSVVFLSLGGKSVQLGPRPRRTPGAGPASRFEDGKRHPGGMAGCGVRIGSRLA